jgi:uncharacterized protein
MLKFDVDRIIQIVTEQIPSVQAIYLFGSKAIGTDSADSDVDVAFFTPFEYKTNPVPTYQVKMQLEVALGRDVDFIHLNQMSTVM